MSKRTPIRHGELLLLPVDSLPGTDRELYDDFICAHSETGHHHVLESDTPFEVASDGEDFFVFLHEEGRLVHQKEVDKHRTLPVAPGGYKIITKREFDPTRGETRFVGD